MRQVEDPGADTLTRVLKYVSVLSVTLVLGFAFALYHSEKHDINRLNAAEHIACLNRRLLTANQRLVLSFLLRNADFLGSHTAGPKTRAYFTQLQVQLFHAYDSTADIPTCNP